LAGAADRARLAALLRRFVEKTAADRIAVCS
jgi:hypothetical protein